MITELLTIINEQDNVRSALSDLRKQLKEQVENDEMQKCIEEQQLQQFLQLLQHEDSKTRKNVALLLGDLSPELKGTSKAEIAEALWQAYMQENTKFVLSSYVKALSYYDCSAFLPKMEQQLKELQTRESLAENVKHERELRKELEELLAKQNDKGQEYVFQGLHKKHNYLLTCEPYMKEILQEELQAYSHIETKQVVRGVMASCEGIRSLQQVRTYHDLMVQVRMKKDYPFTKENLTEALVHSELLPILREAYGKQDYYPFRIQLVGQEQEKGDSKWLKQLSFEIEEKSQHQLQNVKQNYVATVELVGKKDGTFGVFVKLQGLEGDRFSYRKNYLPTSMSPVIAAQMVALIRPYLQEDGNIIDPFCGVGTLLIERLQQQKARHTYGVDTYGEAIAFGRENAELSQENIYFINRNYFDFTSEHLLDEVITEFPRMEHKDKSEVDAFYQAFFDKTEEITAENAMLFLLSTEEAQVKKQIRLHKDFQLLRTIEMRGQEKIFIIKK